MKTPTLVKSNKPRVLKPNEPTAPRPTSCPRCNARKVIAVNPLTASGLAVWRCGSCRSIGYGQRIVGSPTDEGDLGAQTAAGTYRQNLL